MNIGAIPRRKTPATTIGIRLYDLKSERSER
jgi:hypothetical protein